MNWSGIIGSESPSKGDLGAELTGLLEQQRATWPLFRKGQSDLVAIHRKRLQTDEATVIVQCNPARSRSTLAKTDSASIQQRPCFLCPENMPAEERGIAYGRYVVLPNPYPIVPAHLTIPDRHHCPQLLADRFGDLLDLCRALGDAMAVTYNGSSCGASAPDHFHFQAASARALPLLTEVLAQDTSPAIRFQTSFGRRFVVLRGTQDSRVRDDAMRVWAQLQRMPYEGCEPLVNVVGTHSHQGFTLLIVPRAKHRPACFSIKGDGQILVSPAAYEMTGLMVVTDNVYFDRLDARRAHSIYEEVSIEEKSFADLQEAL